MSRLVAYAFTALIIAAPSLASAQTDQPMQGPQSAQPMQGPHSMPMRGAQAATEPLDLTDIRIEVVKSALQLTPEQMKYWPAVEEAIRTRAESRRHRLETLAMRMREGQADRNFVRVLQTRADALYERAAALNKLASAWQPLYASLDEAQKRRMRILGVLVIHRLREGIEDRRQEMMEMQMEDEGAMGAMTGAGAGESGLGRE